MLIFALAVAMTSSSDPLFAQQPALQQIHVPEAWGETVGNPDQRVGIVDTGLERAHEEMADGKDGGGYDFKDLDADYTDTEPNGALYHGSHVAGIIAAPGDDGKGIAGINWRAKVVMARALGGLSGGTNISSMNGAKWLAGIHLDGVPDNTNPVDVINMSLGFVGACDPDTQKAVDDIVAKGVAIIAATGNHGAAFGGTTDATIQTPANCNGVIAVGAVDGNGNVTDYTNDQQGTIDIVAPGGTDTAAILSLGQAPSQYVRQQGTSMATPHVTGVVSLMLAQDPSLSPAAIKSILTSLPSCSGCNGAPLLDAKAALDAVAGKGGNKGPTAGGCSSSTGAPVLAVLAVLLVSRRIRRSS